MVRGKGPLDVELLYVRATADKCRQEDIEERASLYIKYFWITCAVVKVVRIWENLRIKCTILATEMY